MQKTQYKEVEKPLLVDTETLKAITQSGRSNAVKIGSLASAKVQIGRCVRWNAAKVQKYLDSIATE